MYATIRKAKEIIGDQLGTEDKKQINSMAFFVSWNLKENKLKLMIDFEGHFLESVWLA